jgi:hypothetical protein
MKCFYERLLDLPVEELEKRISRQRNEIEIMERDLETMKRAMAQKYFLINPSTSQESPKNDVIRGDWA